MCTPNDRHTERVREDSDKAGKILATWVSTGQLMRGPIRICPSIPYSQSNHEPGRKTVSNDAFKDSLKKYIKKSKPSRNL